jgi:hypothetical protein
MSALEFHEVSKRYPAGLLGKLSLPALSAVSFQVEPGQVSACSARIVPARPLR